MGEYMEEMDEMEQCIDEMQQLDSFRYGLKRHVGDTILGIAVKQHPNMPDAIWVEIARAYPTMENPVLERLANIYDPNELVILASMALFAWERVARLKAANVKLEPSG